MSIRNIWFFKRGIENSIVLYILLFGACLNFLGRGPIFFFMYSIYGIVMSKNVKWNHAFIPYLGLTLSAFVASLLFFDTMTIVKSFTYFMSFFSAYRGYHASNSKESFLFRTIWAATLGFFMHLLLLYLSNFMILEHIEGERTLVDFWTGELIKVTIVGLVSAIPIAFSFYCIFLSRRIITTLLGIGFVVVAFLVNVDTATRTPFVIFTIVYAVLFFELFKSSAKRTKVLLLLLFATLLVIGVFFFLPFLETTALGERYETDGMESSRSQLMVAYSNLMLDYPFGGGFGEKIIHKQAHNFIQEGYDLFGMIFFLSLIIITFQIIVRAIQLHRITKKNNCIYLIFLLYLTILLQSSTEPVIQGYPQLLWFLFVIDGFAIPYIRDYISILEDETKEGD